MTRQAVVPRHGGVHDLATLTEELGAAALKSPAHRSGRTLVAVGDLRVTAIALAAGAELAEHESPGAATLQVLAGSCRLVTAGDPGPAGDGAQESSLDLGAGALAQIPPVRHSLTTEAGCVVLLTVGLDRTG